VKGIELGNITHSEILYTGDFDASDIIAYLLYTEIHIFVIIFVFVILGGSASDYFKKIKSKKNKINLPTIIISGFVIALALFSQTYRFDNLKFLWLISYIGGFCYYGITEILIKFSNNEKLLKKLLLKMLSGINNLSDILKEDNKDNK